MMENIYEWEPSHEAIKVRHYCLSIIYMCVTRWHIGWVDAFRPARALSMILSVAFDMQKKWADVSILK